MITKYRRGGSHTRITPRQEELLHVLERFIAEGKSPTFEELAKEVGISKEGIYDQFVALRDKRYVVWTKRKARSLQVL